MAGELAELTGFEALAGVLAAAFVNA